MPIDRHVRHAMLFCVLLPVLAACGGAPASDDTSAAQPSAVASSASSSVAASSSAPAATLASPQASVSASPATDKAGGDTATQAAAACETHMAQLQQAAAGRTLRIMSAVVGGKNPEEDQLFVAEIKRLTGIDVELVRPPSDYDEKLLAALGGGEVFDLIYLNKNLMDVLVDQGALTDLTAQIQQSPILSSPAIIPSQEWQQISYGDKLYSVFNKFEGGTLPIVRQDWMEKLGLEQPTTLDEFYEVLKAFKERDPDDNGQNDTYGLSTAGLYDIQGFMSAANVKAMYTIDDSGKRSIQYASDAAVPVYEWFAKLYDEGILDPNFATNDTAKMRELFLADRVGMVTYWDAWVGLFNNIRRTDDPNTAFKAVGIVGPTGPDGANMLRRGDPSVWAIPANAANPELAMDWLEFWNCPAGNILGTLGIKDHDYTIVNGAYELTETGKEHGMDHGSPRVYSTIWQNPFGALPGVADAQSLVLDNNAKIEVATPAWPDAKPIVDNYAFKAMSGQMPAAEAVQKMQAELQAAGLVE